MKNKSYLLIPAIMAIIILASVLLRLPFYKNAAAADQGRFIDTETGLPYLTELDSYYHLRMTRDILEIGRPGDTVINGENWDSMSYAPDGRSVSDYHPLMAGIAICVYRLLSVFSSVTLEQTVYWLNTVLSALVVIPVFLLAFELSCLPGAIVAAVLSTLNYGYLIHTTPGFYDTDGVITWVSGLFFYFAVMALRKFEEKNRKAFLLYLTGFLVSAAALYHSWYTHYLFVFILIAALLLYAAGILYRNGHPGSGSKGSWNFRSILPAAGSAGALMVLLLIAEPGVFTSIFSLFENIFTRDGSLFPNIFVSISEMRTPSLLAGGLSGLFQMKVLSESNIGIINAVGGILPAGCAIGMIVLFCRRIWKKDIRPEYFLMIVWYAVTLVLAFRGWRFIMLLAVPTAILAGSLVGTLCLRMDQGKMMDRSFYKAAIVLLLIFPTLYGAYRSYADTYPSANSDLGDAMVKIRENTPEDTILISWWDYGYFFQEKAKRRTLFDGGSQTGIRCYWVAKALTSSNETLSANILRMLSANGDQGCLQMLETFGETEDTLAYMDELLYGSRDSADRSLSGKDISPAAKDELLELLFPAACPPMECVITPDMASISGWFASFGMRKGDNADDGSGYSALISRTEIPPLKEGELTNFRTGNGFSIVIGRSDGQYTAYTTASEDLSPAMQPYPVEKVIVINDGICSVNSTGSVNTDTDDGTVWHIILEEENDRTFLSLVSASMSDSVFGKLYYCRGAGMDRFSAETWLSDDVYLYRVE